MEAIMESSLSVEQQNMLMALSALPQTSGSIDFFKKIKTQLEQSLLTINEKIANLSQWHVNVKPYYPGRPHFVITKDDSGDRVIINMEIRCCNKERIINCIQLVENNKDIVREQIYTISEHRGRDDYVIINKNESGYIIQNGIGTEGAGGDYYFKIEKDNLIELLQAMTDAL
jgi:hypothetical protein